MTYNYYPRNLTLWKIHREAGKLLEALQALRSKESNSGSDPVSPCFQYALYSPNSADSRARGNRDQSSLCLRILVDSLSRPFVASKAYYRAQCCHPPSDFLMQAMIQAMSAPQKFASIITSVRGLVGCLLLLLLATGCT